jgi:hypothetical protein
VLPMDVLLCLPEGLFDLLLCMHYANNDYAVVKFRFFWFIIIEESVG